MERLDSIKEELEKAFPEYSFTIGKRIYGKCIIAKNTKYSGADIFVKENKIVIEASIPETRTRFLIGSGAAFLKLFSKNYSQPSLRIVEFLSSKYENVVLRT